MHNGENVGDNAGGPDQPTEGEEGVAQVESLPHCETNLAIVGNQVKDEYELTYIRSSSLWVLLWVFRKRPHREHPIQRGANLTHTEGSRLALFRESFPLNGSPLSFVMPAA